jgi:predicted ATPase
MKITNLEIQKIKSVGEKIQLHFEQCINIFIGPNGSGKSKGYGISSAWMCIDNLNKIKI